MTRAKKDEAKTKTTPAVKELKGVKDLKELNESNPLLTMLTQYNGGWIVVLVHRRTKTPYAVRVTGNREDAENYATVQIKGGSDVIVYHASPAPGKIEQRYVLGG